MRIVGAAALCGLGLGLAAGCSGDNASAPVAVATHAQPTATGAKRGPAPEELTAGMVEAVVQGKSPLASLVKFELSDRPVVGQQLDVAIALIPKISGSAASLKMSVTPDVDLVPGYERLDIPKIEASEVYRDRVKVVPKQEGVALLTIELTLKHDDLSDSKIFAVPLIVSGK